MKKVFKKMKAGFTLVELVVVIAIIAILGTVSVVGYFAFIDKANLSNDTTVTTQINTALQADEVINGHPGCLTNASKVMEENGIIFEDLTAASKGYRYAYDAKNNRVVLLDDHNEPTEPLKGSKKSDVFVVIDSAEEGAKFSDYSWYLSSKYNKADELDTTNGVDVGNAKKLPRYINYSDSIEEKVVFYTRDRRLTIENEKAEVLHYGSVEQVFLNAVAQNSYHEFGSPKIIEAIKGHIVLEKSAYVMNINVKSSDVSIEAKCDLNETAIVLGNGVTKESVTLPQNAPYVFETNGKMPIAHLSSTNKDYVDAEELERDLSINGGTLTLNPVYTTGNGARIVNIAGGTVIAPGNPTQNAIVLKKDTVIDCSGINLSITSFYGFYITEPNVNLTLKNGKIEATSNSVVVEAGPDSNGTISLENAHLSNQYREGTINVGGNATLNIDKNSSITRTKINTNNETCAVFMTGNSTVNVYGTITSHTAYAISGDGNVLNQNTTLNVYDGAKITSDLKETTAENGVAIYLPQNGTLNMTGGFVEGPTGIVVKSGTVNITGGKVRGTLNAIPYSPVGDGYKSTGDALVICLEDYPNGNPTNVNVNGVTLETNDNSAHAYVVYYQDDADLAGCTFTGNVERLDSKYTPAPALVQ